jgi:hypothetical protein
MDLLRVLPPHEGGVSASHAYLNRNKRSLALDLKQPAALEIIKQLLGEYDIVLEQFRPGVMERLGLGYEALKAINPRLIYVSISGYGQTGPYKERAGHDINYLALAGLASYTGRCGWRLVARGDRLAGGGDRSPAERARHASGCEHDRLRVQPERHGRRGISGLRRGAGLGGPDAQWRQFL